MTPFAPPDSVTDMHNCIHGPKANCHKCLVSELVRVLEGTRDVIHGFVCIAGDKGGDYRCWKECNDACTVLEKAKLIDPDCEARR